MFSQQYSKHFSENHEESHTKGTEPVANMNKGDILQQAECDEVSLPVDQLFIFKFLYSIYLQYSASVCLAQTKPCL